MNAIKKATVPSVNTTSATIRESAPSLGNRQHPAWAPGDVAHQGDLIFVGLAGVPAYAKPRSNRQLAEGETRGSKHVVDGGAVYDLVKPADAGLKGIGEAYIGPVFVGPCVVTHPQHQHHEFPEGSVVCVVYQRNLDAEEREVRARD